MKLPNIVTLIALLTVVDHSSSSRAVLATTKTSEYETKYETIPKQEQEGDVVVVAPLLPTLLRGAKKAVYQFLSDGDSEELSCGNLDDDCQNDDDCCGDNICTSYNQCEEPVPCVNLGYSCDPDTACCGDLVCDETDIVVLVVLLIDL